MPGGKLAPGGGGKRGAGAKSARRREGAFGRGGGGDAQTPKGAWPGAAPPHRRHRLHPPTCDTQDATMALRALLWAAVTM
jgi:hypothetical protein